MLVRRMMALWVLAPLLLVGCADGLDSPPADESIVGLEASMMVAGCDTRDLKKFSRDYFSRPEEAVARSLISDIAAACESADAETATTLVLDLLVVVEDAIAASNQGAASDGNLLVNEALKFASFPCVVDGSCAPIDTDFTAALSPGGAFKVVDGSVAGEADPVIARGLPVHDTWVVEPGSAGDWQAVLGQRSIIYGFPAPSQLPLQETALVPIQYEWEVIPAAAAGFLTQPVVGVCYVAEDPEGIATVQRNSTLLEPSGVAACATVTAAVPSSLSDRILGFADWLVRPQPLHASAAQLGGGTGGRPTDFSTFAAVDAVVTGRLVFVTQPDPVNTADEPIGGPVAVQAVTDNGTPIEHVLVALSAEVNNGSTVAITNNEEFTQEGGGVATFPNVSINKPGGYVLCATAIQTDSYSIAGACSDPLHIRN